MNEPIKLKVNWNGIKALLANIPIISTALFISLSAMVVLTFYFAFKIQDKNHQLKCYKTIGKDQCNLIYN